VVGMVQIIIENIDDIGYGIKVKGIGTKTLERILLEKMSKQEYTGVPTQCRLPMTLLKPCYVVYKKNIFVLIIKTNYRDKTNSIELVPKQKITSIYTEILKS
jgi:hypothetical protein